MGGVDGNNYEVILIFQGGDNPQELDYSTKDIQNAIDKINANNTPVSSAATNKSQNQSGTVISSSPSSQQVK